MSKIENLNNSCSNLPDVKELLKSWNINQALFWVLEKVKTWLEFSKEFLRDLFKIWKIVSSFDKKQCQNCCSIFDSNFKK